MNSKICKEKRAEILLQMEGVAQKIKNEKRNMSEEERGIFDSFDREQEALMEQAESFERIERIEGLTGSQSRSKIREEVLFYANKGSKPAVEERNKAYAGWFYHGSTHQKAEYWRAAERLDINVASNEMRFDWLPWEQRGTGPQTITPATAGGDTVAVDVSFMRNIDVALKAYGNIFDWCTVIDTKTGASLPYPLTSDVSNTGEFTPEASGVNVQDMTFAQNTLSAYKQDSGFVKVSWELLNDSILDLTSFLAKALGVRIGRRLNASIIATGNGVNQPNNIIGEATDSGVSVASASTVTYLELLSYFHSVDPAYRDEPGCAWVWSDSFLQMLRGVVDDNGRNILNSSLEGVAGGWTNTLFGKRYYINQAVPAVAGSAKVALFGDMSKVIVRRVVGDMEGGLHLLKLSERYADNGLVAFLAWGRFDAILSDAGTHPVKYLTMHS